jgi:hypothetical protein
MNYSNQKIIKKLFNVTLVKDFMINDIFKLVPSSCLAKVESNNHFILAM